MTKHAKSTFSCIYYPLIIMLSTGGASLLSPKHRRGEAKHIPITQVPPPHSNSPSWKVIFLLGIFLLIMRVFEYIGGEGNGGMGPIFLLKFHAK